MSEINIFVENHNCNIPVTVSPVGLTGRTGENGPNSVTSETTSDGTANLLLESATVSNLLTANHIHGNLAGTLYTHVRSGEALAKGDPVYISGFHSGSSQPIVMKADAADSAKMPAIGVIDADYANNTSSANCIIAGNLTSIDTDGMDVNSGIYVANGGGYSNTPGTIKQQIPIILRRSSCFWCCWGSRSLTTSYEGNISISSNQTIFPS